MGTPTGVGCMLYGSDVLLFLQMTASKFANPPLFPAPERQEKPMDGSIYANQVVYKRPLAHSKSIPIAPEKPKRAPPKPKLPADLAADIRSSKKLRSPTAVPVTPTRNASLHSTSSRGSTPDMDIIPINAPKRNSNDYENTADYENTDGIISPVEMQRTSPLQVKRTLPPTATGHEHKPMVLSRGRSETSFPESKSSFNHRNRADTVGDMLSSTSPTVKPRSMTVAGLASPKKHDYEEINDDIGEV